MTKRTAHILFNPTTPRLVALTMLGCLSLSQLWAGRTAPNAEFYHETIRHIAAQSPVRIGEWVARDTPVPSAAVALLRPNVILSKQYVNFRSGAEVQLLIVQCRDARDLIGHYPPICYAAHGWKLKSTESHDWTINDQLYHGTRYHFSPGTSNQIASLIISNFMLIPGADNCRDMKGVDAAAKDHRRRLLGAAQVQIVTSDRLTIEDHGALLDMIVTAYQNLIEAISAKDILGANGGGGQQ
ncbi:MAG: EpsI family protein [Phycisphaerales bacterium]|nr:EpsI family protein [Phycisphaerales bacterium]